MPAIAIHGTTSNAGKTIITTALCRIFADKGYRVTPFKSQNMSLNSCVLPNGGEIARAQALQAHAARVEPTVEMNPILLKPKAEHVSQVVIRGRPYADMNVKEYHDFVERQGREIVETSLKHLSSEYDLIIMEGAGSPAEINILQRDIVNMYPAKLAGAKCILVHNINYGSTIEYLFGTLNLLGNERELYSGIILNKSRGTVDTVELERILEKPIFGVVPHIEDLHLPEEDSLSLKNQDEHFDVGVIRLPHMSNFTDFDALTLEGLKVRYISREGEIKRASVLIIPGTKNTILDLKWLREQGRDHAIVQAANDGRVIIGICGGYQMLGKRIIDSGFENNGEEIDGLGLLDVVTRFDSYTKITERIKGTIVGNGILEEFQGKEITGYEIHMGQTSTSLKPCFIIDRGGKTIQDGAINGSVFGTYVHGIFDNPPIRKAVLKAIQKPSDTLERDLDDEIDKLANIFSASVDLEKIEALI
ncbi:MAG: cobyric acid synthase [Methanocellales archaeon]|nr:cobyric acid synthase [Methanocellales archaeon]MDD3291498.1 cobyric acid synthase [Methanocellales archaeon]MDD5234612.1 cobyric acid synthase [Methanocellales archaeon]MDD5485035.1 cobyric acid synthase [Methanocellales archaeon]